VRPLSLPLGSNSGRGQPPRYTEGTPLRFAVVCNTDMATELVPHTFTVDQYRRMADAGIIEADERTELLDGLIVTMPPIGIPHVMTQGRIFKYLERTLEERALVVGGISIPLGTRNEPYPDLAVLENFPYDRPNLTPEPAQIYAIVEVADASLATDALTKRRLYARFSIADYLVVDLSGNVVLHFSQPSDGDYAEPRRLGRDDEFRLAALPAIVLDANRFLD
jgi:Uma2 family endonuclease